MDNVFCMAWNFLAKLLRDDKNVHIRISERPTKYIEYYTKDLRSYIIRQ